MDSNTDKPTLKIGWLGTGFMGKPICDRLLSAGYQLHIYNRTKSKTEELIKKGAIFLSPEEIAKECDIIFTMLGYPIDVRNLILDDETALIKYFKPNAILVDHTTNSPKLAEELYSKLKEKGVQFFDAPVSGQSLMAEKGQLTIMVGGDKEGFEKVEKVMKVYGSNIRYMGSAGKGQQTKLTVQISLAINLFGVVETLLYGYNQGLDLQNLMQVLELGAANSAVLKAYGPKLLKRDFEAAFYIEYWIKDCELILEEARMVNLCLPCFGLIKQFYQAVMAQGGPKTAWHEILVVLEKLNNVQLPKVE